MSEKFKPEKFVDEYSCDIVLRWTGIDPALLPIDDLDKAIICMLRHNARIPNSEISKILKTSEATVRRRIAELTRKKIILGFAALVDLQAIENSIKVFLKIKVDSDKLDAVAGRLSNNINILGLYRRRGENEIIAETLFLNMETLQNFEDMMTKVDGVTNFETMIVSKAYKRNPWIGI